MARAQVSSTSDLEAGRHEPAADSPKELRTHLLRHLRPLLPAALVYLASRVVTFASAWLASLVTGRPLARVLSSWDGNWYIAATLFGYPRTAAEGSFVEGTGARVESPIAFFPLYPLVTRALRWVLPLSPYEAAVLASLFFGGVAALLVWLIAAQVFDRRVADRTVVLFCFFPGAFVLSWVYAEALMLALAAACLLALLRRRWLLAGLAAALAGATRPNALALVLACAWVAGVAVWKRREWRALVAPALAPIGALAYFAFLWRHTGDPFVWFYVQRHGWGEGIDFGRHNLEVALDFVTDPLSDPLTFIVGLGLALVIFTVVLLVRARLPGALNVYALGLLGLTLASQTLSARPRFILSAFPLLIPLAKAVKGTAFAALASAFGGCMAILGVLYALQKGNIYP